MAAKKHSVAKISQKSTEKCESAKPVSRCSVEAEKGVHDSMQFANVFSALLTDILCGREKPDVANAACNVGGKLLKVVEMQHKYGGGGGPLPLAGPK